MAEELVLKFVLDKCTECRVLGKQKDALVFFNLFFRVVGVAIGDTMNARLKNININLSKEFIQMYIGILTELSIISYYIENHKKYGAIISDRLILTNIGSCNRGMVANNQRFYLEKIDRITKIPITPKTEKFYNCMNSSIIKTDYGYLINARTVNYVLHDDGNYEVKDGTNLVNTKNYIMLFNKDFEVLCQNELIDTDLYQNYPSRVIGLEDVIVFNDDKKNLYCTCTTIDTNPQNLAQMTLCKINYDVSEDNKILVVSKRPIYFIQEGRSEKNWLPYYENNAFKFIYSYGPTIVRKINHTAELFNDIDYVNSEIESEKEVKLGLNLERFRGSAGPLPFDHKGVNGILLVVHEVIWPNGNNSRNYTHRFVFMTKDMEITHMSLPFYFEELSVEFCRSMCYSHYENILLTVGIKDKESWIYSLDKYYVSDLLLDLEHFEI